jgi:putative transcriptional regulator
MRFFRQKWLKKLMDIALIGLKTVFFTAFVSPPACGNGKLMQMNLVGHFLISMPAMQDPHFAGTVIYLCEHTQKGALGLVINRPTELTVNSLFEKIDLTLEIEYEPIGRAPVYYGGPVQTDRGFVLHTPAQNDTFSSSLKVEDSLALTTSKDVLEAMSRGQGPLQTLITLGYSGWGEGQLEKEIAQNAWLTVKADADIIFNVAAEQRFTRAMKLLGVDPTRIMPGAGRA